MNLHSEIADRPARILIVDDERHHRQLLEVMLAPEGFHLLTAASGEEALALVAHQPPDLILLDIVMPNMNGYEVAGRIKSDLATKNIPIIVVTAPDDRSARMLGLSAGAEDFLTKPVDRAELCVRVKNLLRLKACGDNHDQRRQVLEGDVGQTARTHRFLSHVSRELRSPLSAIEQSTTILLGGLAGELNDEQRRHQQIVLDSARQLQSIIDDLRDVPWIEIGHGSVEPASPSVSEAVADNSIAPLLTLDNRPAESVALVMVEISLLDAWPSKESEEEWARQAPGLVQRCLQPELNMVSPAMSSGPDGERFLFVVRAPAERTKLVAAFADAKGASVLANRIREQFDRLTYLQQTGFAISVSYRMLEPSPDGPVSMTSTVTSRPTTLDPPIAKALAGEDL